MALLYLICIAFIIDFAAADSSTESAECNVTAIEECYKLMRKIQEDPTTRQCEEVGVAYDCVLTEMKFCSYDDLGDYDYPHDEVHILYENHCTSMSDYEFNDEEDDDN